MFEFYTFREQSLCGLLSERCLVCYCARIDFNSALTLLSKGSLAGVVQGEGVRKGSENASEPSIL